MSNNILEPLWYKGTSLPSKNMPTSDDMDASELSSDEECEDGEHGYVSSEIDYNGDIGYDTDSDWD